MKINCAYTELVDLHKLQPNPKNPNKHPEKQISMLAKIIDYQGQRAPIVVSKRSGFITKGHGRLMAIQKLGWSQCAVDYQDYESEAQEYADMVADNKIAELAEHDDEFMYQNLQDFPDLSVDLLGIPVVEVDSIELPELTDAPRKELRQMAFQLTERQLEIAERAVKIAKKHEGYSETDNQNSNANAFELIANTFITQFGSLENE